MPEAAEVQLTIEYLNICLENKIIKKWNFISGQYEEEKPKGFDKFEKNLPLIVENVECKGKFIYITTFNENGYHYILHSLRMTGRWQNYEDKYCRWNIEIDGENDKLWFRNPRCLATLEFTTDKSVLEKALNNLGPSILSSEFSLDKWNEMIIQHKNKNITSFLMNQNIFSGIGNYIKAEALYYAKISPLRKTGSLNPYEASKLYEGVKIIPRIAYNKNGLSIKDYKDFDGEKGNYEEDLKIYGKSNAKKTKTADGRTTYWDPKIQK
jgi:formamidopyrimidine-DNA glycosylase